MAWNSRPPLCPNLSIPSTLHKLAMPLSRPPTALDISTSLDTLSSQVDEDQIQRSFCCGSLLSGVWILPPANSAPARPLCPAKQSPELTARCARTLLECINDYIHTFTSRQMIGSVRLRRTCTFPCRHGVTRRPVRMHLWLPCSSVRGITLGGMDR